MDGPYPELPLMSTDITRYYWTNETQSLKSMDPINTQDVNRPFSNLILLKLRYFASI